MIGIIVYVVLFVIFFGVVGLIVDYMDKVKVICWMCLVEIGFVVFVLVGLLIGNGEFLFVSFFLYGV